jgi:hypothetical protein
VRLGARHVKGGGPLLADCNAPQMGQSPPACAGRTSILFCASEKMSQRPPELLDASPTREDNWGARQFEYSPLCYTAEQVPLSRTSRCFLAR